LKNSKCVCEHFGPIVGKRLEQLSKQCSTPRAQQKLALFCAQVLWPKKGAFDNANDLKEQAFYRFIAKTYWGHIALQFALLYAIGGWPWFVWLGCVRVSHACLLVN
jgi:hypothetical protein